MISNPSGQKKKSRTLLESGTGVKTMDLNKD